MKALIKYFKIRKVAVNFTLEKPTWAYTPDTFHKLRVEIKKLNALFELTQLALKRWPVKKTYFGTCLL